MYRREEGRERKKDREKGRRILILVKFSVTLGNSFISARSSAEREI